MSKTSAKFFGEGRSLEVEDDYEAYKAYVAY